MQRNKKTKFILDHTGAVIAQLTEDQELPQLPDQECIAVTPEVFFTAANVFTLQDAPANPDDGSDHKGLEGQFDLCADYVCGVLDQTNPGTNSTADDGWSYPLQVGCGNYLYGETVRQDKVRVFTLDGQDGTHPVHTLDSPFGNAGDGGTLGADQIFLPPLGRGSAQFKVEGSKSGRLAVTHKDLTGDFYLGAWVYFGDSPSSDQSIVSKLDETTGFTGPVVVGAGLSGPTGGISGGSGDVFRLWVEDSSNNLNFSFTENGDSATFLTDTLTIGNVGTTISLRNWHHIAVSIENKTNSAQGYLNSVKTALTSISGNGLKNSKLPIYIGARRDGTEGTGVRMKDLIIKSGNTADVLIGVNGIGLTGATLDGATFEQSLTGGTLYYFSFDGRAKCRNFAVETQDFGTAKVVGWFPDYQQLGLRDTTVNGSFEFFKNNQGFIHGLSSGAMYLSAATSDSTGISANLVTTVQETTKGRIEGDLVVQTENFNLTGGSGTGDSGVPNFFQNLFGLTGTNGSTLGTGIIGTGNTGPTGHAGESFGFEFNDENFSFVQALVITINGQSGGASGGRTSAVKDSTGKVFHLTDQEVVGLYTDLISYQEFINDVVGQGGNLADNIDNTLQTGNQVSLQQGKINLKKPQTVKFSETYFIG